MSDQPAAEPTPDPPVGEALPSKGAFEPFRPRRGRAVALGFQWGSLILFGVLALVLPATAGGAVWGVGDRVMFFLIGVAIAWMAHRYASIVAVPSREGLVVRNLMLTRTLAWPEIVAVRFAGGDPWVSLDLNDADTVAVMAIQKADGPAARTEAARLAALVHALGEQEEPESRGPSE